MTVTCCLYFPIMLPNLVGIQNVFVRSFFTRFYSFGLLFLAAYSSSPQELMGLVYFSIALSWLDIIGPSVFDSFIVRHARIVRTDFAYLSLSYVLLRIALLFVSVPCFVYLGIDQEVVYWIGLAGLLQGCTLYRHFLLHKRSDFSVDAKFSFLAGFGAFIFGVAVFLTVDGVYFIYLSTCFFFAAHFLLSDFRSLFPGSRFNVRRFSSLASRFYSFCLPLAATNILKFASGFSPHAAVAVALGPDLFAYYGVTHRLTMGLLGEYQAASGSFLFTLLNRQAIYGSAGFDSIFSVPYVVLRSVPLAAVVSLSFLVWCLQEPLVWYIYFAVVIGASFLVQSIGYQTELLRLLDRNWFVFGFSVWRVALLLSLTMVGANLYALVGFVSFLFIASTSLAFVSFYFLRAVYLRNSVFCLYSAFEWLLLFGAVVLSTCFVSGLIADAPQ